MKYKSIQICIPKTPGTHQVQASGEEKKNIIFHFSVFLKSYQFYSEHMLLL